MPLVLHGASGVPKELVEKINKYGGDLEGAQGIHPDDIRLAIKEGISKINTDTDLRLAFTGAVREVLYTNPKVYDPRKILGPAREEMKRVVKERIELFGSAGKA